MPIYEYRCNACGNVFDEIRQMSASDAPINCYHCHSQDTKRKPSSFFSHSPGNTNSSNRSGCGSCAGGSCSNCH